MIERDSRKKTTVNMSGKNKKLSKKELEKKKKKRKIVPPRELNEVEKEIKEKLVVLLGIILLAFAGLCVRLYVIVRDDGDTYTRKILSQQKYDSITIPFRRGDIVDCKGTKLAVCENVYNVILDVHVINDAGKLLNEDFMTPTMQALDMYLNLDMEKVRNYANNNPDSQYYVLAKRLSYDEIDGLQNAMNENDSKIKGIWFEKEYRRYYPLGTIACDAIGFTSKDNVGFSGLEAYYDDILNGTTGREFGYLNDDSTLERTVKPAEDGYTIQTTLDANIQAIIQKHLIDFNEKYKNNARTGNGAENVGCIIMEVDTGRILGMESYPFYDLNNIRDTNALLGNVMVDENGNKTKEYITEESLAQMDENTLYQNFNYLWKNFCITDTYEPGSTAKPFTTAIGLETGALTGEEVFQCNGYLEIGGHRIRCHTRTGDGQVTVEDGIAYSCNVALMHEAQAIGIKNFSKFQKAFNFGLKTNIDLEGEARTASLIVGADAMTPTDLAVYSFGQGFNVTMIQMITGFCSLINGGYYYEPHMVDKIINASGATVKNIEPRVLRQTVSESTSEKIRQYCTAVVMRQGDTRITGRTARPAGYAIGGKTGTAQTIDRETHTRSSTEYVVSFMGFAPADDPQIAIYVVIDRANIVPQDQARLATVLTRNILSEVLPYLNIFMTEELSEAEMKELEERQLAITLQYANPEEENTENGEGTEEKGELEKPAWMSFPIDPSTGHRVDPETGEHLDPETGDPVNGGYGGLE